jgi:hypothetical protein
VDEVLVDPSSLSTWKNAMWMLFVKLFSPVEWWLEPKAKLHAKEITSSAN